MKFRLSLTCDNTGQYSIFTPDNQGRANSFAGADGFLQDLPPLTAYSISSTTDSLSLIILVVI